MKFKKQLYGAVAISLVFVMFVTFINKNASTSVRFGQTTLPVEVVDTPEERVRGLSGKPSLPENKGMLFIFDEPGIHCIWMKDMNFPIDIVWADEDKKVTQVQSNVSPATYPDEFCPEEPAHYVLEVNAGYSERMNLTAGTQLQF